MKINKAHIWLVAVFCCYGCLGETQEKNVEGKSKIKNDDSKRFFYINSNRVTKGRIPDDDTFAETPKKSYDFKVINASQYKDENTNDAASIDTKEMYCFNYARNSKTVSKSFKGKSIQRLVVYFYAVKDDDDNVKQYLYIPGTDNQHRMPDLPLRETDLLASAAHLKVSDILNQNNPFILMGKNFPSVPGSAKHGNVERSKIHRFKNTLNTNCHERNIFDLHLTYCNYRSETTIIITQPKLRVPRVVESNLPDLHESTSSLIAQLKNLRDYGLKFWSHINKNKMNVDDIQVEPDKDDFAFNFDTMNTIREHEVIENDLDISLSDADLLEDSMSLDNDFSDALSSEYDSAFENVEHHPIWNKHSTAILSLDNDFSDAISSEYDSAFENIEHHPIWNKHSTAIFEKWFNDKVHKDSSLLTQTKVNENRFRKIIHDALIYSGISITSHGKLKDAKGNLYDFDNIEMIPVFIGVNRFSPYDNFDYDSPLPRKYIKAVVIMSKKPKAVLSVTPIIAKPVKIVSEKHIGKTEPHFKIVGRTGLIDRAPIQDGDLYDFNDISIGVNKKLVYEIPKDERADVEILEDLLSSNDKDKAPNDEIIYSDDIDDIDSILPKILGGYEALGSGSQISNKG